MTNERPSATAFPPLPPKGPHHDLLLEISARCVGDRDKRTTTVPWDVWDKIHLALLNAPTPPSAATSPVAWRYRYIGETPGMWKYANTEDERNPLSCCERMPLYAAPQVPAMATSGSAPSEDPGSDSRPIAMSDCGNRNGVIDYPAVAAPSQLSSIAVPDGWKLVPLEPTEQMAGAGMAGTEAAGSPRGACNCYRQMLAAAPTPRSAIASPDTRRLDHIAKTLHIDATGDEPIFAMFIAGVEPHIAGQWDARRIIDESIKVTGEASDRGGDR